MDDDGRVWKHLAEVHYGRDAYPMAQHLAEGSLDAYFAAHREEILSDLNKREAEVPEPVASTESEE